MPFSISALLSSMVAAFTGPVKIPTPLYNKITSMVKPTELTCKNDRSFVSQTPFMVHVHMLQEFKLKLAERAMKPTKASHIEHKNKRRTQTESYLKTYKSQVKERWGTDIATHQPMIDQIIAREKMLLNTHYCFYHAHAKELMVLQDFIKGLRCTLMLMPARTDFTFMRIKEMLKTLTPLAYGCTSDYLDAQSSINDCSEPHRTHMLCANLSLFGNTTHSGECTFFYFTTNSSCSIDLQSRLASIFEYYGLPKKYLKELVALSEHLTSKTGNLLQICIPHGKVDQLVYLSKAYGPAYSSPLTPKHFSSQKKRHTAITPLLERYCSDPSRLGSYETVDQLQARILFLDPLLDGDPDIKIYRYTTIPEDIMHAYSKKMQNLVERILTDYLSRNKHSTDFPLVRLHRYMNTNQKGITS